MNDWHGQGWIIVDPASGAAGYLLAGRLISGNTIEVTHGGSTSSPSPQTTTGSGLGHFLGNLFNLLHHIQAIGTTIGLMFLCVLGMAYSILCGSLLTFPMGVLIGAFTLFLLYIVLYALLYEGLPPAIFGYRRHRKKVYATVTPCYA